MHTTAIIFCIPLFLVPLIWTKVLLWRLPEDTDLAVYFGRCLGALGLVIDYFIISSALNNKGTDLVFNSLYILFFLMVVTHIYGAVKRIQPITETLETGFRALMFVLNYVFHPPAV